MRLTKPKKSSSVRIFLLQMQQHGHFEVTGILRSSVRTVVKQLLWGSQAFPSDKKHAEQPSCGHPSTLRVARGGEIGLHAVFSDVPKLPSPPLGCELLREGFGEFRLPATVAAL